MLDLLNGPLKPAEGEGKLSGAYCIIHKAYRPQMLWCQ